MGKYWYINEIELLQEKLKRKTSLTKRGRIYRRINNLRAKLVAHTLANS